MQSSPAEDAVARCLRDLFYEVDPRKVRQVAAMLGELERLVGGTAREHVIVDLACGKAYVLHALAALLRPRARYIGVERDPERVEKCRIAARRLGMRAQFFEASIAQAPLGERPDVVIALHACGGAADEVIDRAIELSARHLLLVPCCHARARAPTWSGVMLPRQGVLRGRLLDALTDTDRMLRLEASGYEVVALELCPPAVTPHNLLLRARYVGQTGRAARAAAARQRIAPCSSSP